MPTRDEDDLVIEAGLSASRDEAQGRQPTQDQTPRNEPSEKAKTSVPKSSTEPKASSTKRTDAVRSEKGRGFVWLSGIVMLGLILACGWLGQQVLQLQQRLEANNNALQLERSRMESISAQVHETGSSFEETGNVLDEKFKLFDSEIRKLWDVSNKRNKSAIEENAAQVKTLSGNLKKAQQSLQTLNGSVSETKKSVEQINKRLVAENTALRATLDDQAEQVLLMRSKMELLQKRLSNVPNDLVTRVASNEEAVEAIDAGRRQLVARITQLQKQVDALLLEKNTGP